MSNDRKMLHFGKLQKVNLRDIWRYETQDFTPWLADNIALLSKAIGMELEVLEVEKAVEQFYADIVARDTRSGNIVLIENQLEKTDHSHLGQILTYLSGLEAKSVIWISPEFQEPHLSAIRWLNEHTSEDFGFLAVRIKVVRIGDSLPAPVFEVLEQPSEWDRQLSRTKRAGEYTPEAEKRLAFWEFHRKRHPEAAQAGVAATRHWVNWLPVHAHDGMEDAVQIILSIGSRNSGLYVRGGWENRKHSAQELLAPYMSELIARLGLPEKYYSLPKEGHVFGEFRPLPYTDESRWPELSDWLEERRQKYTKAICEILGNSRRQDASSSTSHD